MRLPVLRPVLAAASILLAGCGAPVKEPPVPLDQPLLPATIYVPDCANDGGFLAGAESAPGREICRLMAVALMTSMSGLDGQANVTGYVSKEGRGHVGFTGHLQAPEMTPDLAAEAHVRSKYRIVLAPASSGFEPAGGGMRMVGTSLKFVVFDVASGEMIGDARLDTWGVGLAGALELAGPLVRGLQGHRCEVLNKFTVKTATHKSSPCTYVLSPT